MKIKPVILCGGAGTRLWPKSKKNLPKQPDEINNKIQKIIFKKPLSADKIR